MLEVVKKKVNRKCKKSFDERFIDYMLSVQDMNIELEIKYFKTHNKLDVLKLDRWVELAFNEAIEHAKR